MCSVPPLSLPSTGESELPSGVRCRTPEATSDSPVDGTDRGGTEHMIAPSVHEIARQRHQDLLARADRYRLVRQASDGNAHARAAFCRLRFLVDWALRVSRLRAGVPANREDATARGANGAGAIRSA